MNRIELNKHIDKAILDSANILNKCKIKEEFKSNLKGGKTNPTPKSIQSDIVY